MTYSYKDFKELQTQIRQAYLDENGVRKIPVDVDKGITISIKTILTNYSVVLKRDKIDGHTS